MPRKKNKFLTFIFSLFPGAGEMYLGFYKQGISIMGVFLLLMFLSSVMNLGVLMYLIVIPWFFSFFHTNNINAVPEEEFYQIEDSLFFLKNDNKVTGFLEGKAGRKIAAVCCIILGSCALWGLFTDIITDILEYSGMETGLVYRILYSVPQMIFGIAIIMLGVYLIKGKKKELESQSESQLDSSAEQNQNQEV